MKTYIASPFFDEKSCKWVSEKEEFYSEGTHGDFYSPRQDGLKFGDLKGKERSDMIKRIFRSNVDALDTCDTMVANINKCNGRLDIGTLWEIGYFIGKYRVKLSEELSLEFDIESIDSVFLASRIEDFLVIQEGVNQVDNKSEELIVTTDHDLKIRATVDFLNLNAEVLNLDSNFSFESLAKILDSRRVVILTDSFPPILFVLMGWMYAKGKPYFTASFLGYGSNVMIAASSLGHMRIPFFNDDTFNNNIE